MEKDKVLELVKAEVENMMSLLEIDTNITYNSEIGENGVIVVSVNIDGDDLGFMIGNKGAHMLSMQYVISNIVRNKVKAESPETSIAVVLDVAGYRSQKQDRIEQLALQKADDARILGDSIDLPPMSASDRRVVHATLAKFDDVKTESFGEGYDRFVRITPLKDEEIGVSSEVNDDSIEETQE